MTDVTDVRRRLVELSTGMYERSVPYVESSLPESGVPVPGHERAVFDAAEGLIAGNVFTFTLAAVLRVAQESDPALAARLAGVAENVLVCGLDWIETANDDLDHAPAPVEQVSGQQEIPAATETPRGFRAGDRVEITGRHDDESAPEGLKLNGSTGVVTEIDDNPEYPIGLTVEGWVGLVWCNSSEVRHVEAAESGAEQ